MRRTTGAILVAVALALGMVLGSQVITPSSVSAQRKECAAIPKAHGRLITVVGNEFVLEDTAGTIRMFDGVACKVDATFQRN